MADFKVGDRVRIKNRKGWPTPPGYRLAKSEGVVVKMAEWDEVLDEFSDFVKVKIEKTNSDVKVGTQFIFKDDSLEKI
jgi:hypothetical protein